MKNGPYQIDFPTFHTIKYVYIKKDYMIVLQQ